MSWLDDLLQNARNTPPIKGLQDAFQQYGYNRQQGVPLMQGGTGNSVIKALTTGQVGQAQAYSEPNDGSGGGGGGGGAGGGDGWVDPNIQNTGGGGGVVDLAVPTGGSGTNDDGLGAQIALARGAYENRMGDLRRVFDAAKGIYDQGMETIKKRRNEFKDIYNTGQNDILNSYEGERGNIQRSATEGVNRLRNILRATGMGGSAFVRGIGNQDKANLRNLGSLSNEKTFNERENLKGYNANQEWAGNQEGELGRYLRSAQGNYDSGVEKAGLVNMGDVAGINSAFDQLRSNIYNQQAALAAAGGNIGAYKANPFAPNLSDMTNSLNVAMPNFATSGGGNNEAVNLAPENLSYLELLRKRAGGSMYA